MSKIFGTLCIAKNKTGPFFSTSLFLGGPPKCWLLVVVLPPMLVVGCVLKCLES